MNRTLLLTSSGVSLEIAFSLTPLLPKSPQNMQVAFIPTAADPEEDKWFVDAAYKGLKKFGLQVQSVDLKEDPKTIRSRIENSDILFVNGGNTFYLMKWVRQSGLDMYIEEFLDRGKMYVGVSAGSIIAGPDISLASWGLNGDKNISNLRDMHGLNLVPFAVFPHFQVADKLLVENETKGLKYEVKSLPDGQAILIQGNDYKMIGKGKGLPEMSMGIR